MPDHSLPTTLAEQIYSKFLGDLVAYDADGKLLAEALREFMSHGSIGDRASMLKAVKTAVSKEGSSET